MGRAIFGSHTGIDGSKYKVLEQLYIPIPMICRDFPELMKLNTWLLKKHLTTVLNTGTLPIANWII
jgi:hypothetical protein